MNGSTSFTKSTEQFFCIILILAGFVLAYNFIISGLWKFLVIGIPLAIFGLFCLIILEAEKSKTRHLRRYPKHLRLPGE
mgnify:CR=1 FL=1